MTLAHRIISAGFAISALASASVPALGWTLWPGGVDLEWYASQGKPLANPAGAIPAPASGYVWSPPHWEMLAGRSVRVAGEWIRDDDGRAEATARATR